MANKGIHTINVKNFKAFKDLQPFAINGKHMLVYGENGSGKSSLYFSIYTLLQATTRTAEQTSKYFDINSPENLLNIHNSDTEEAYIQLSLTDNPDSLYKLSKTGLDFSDDTLKDLNLASDFISHRLLLNFYNFRNSKEINLFQIFESDIWPFTTPIGKTELFANIINTLAEEVKTLEKKEVNAIRQKLEALNSDIQTQIYNINEKATEFFATYFTGGIEQYKIILEYTSTYTLVGRTNNYSLSQPHIKLSLKRKMSDGSFKIIERPQSYLNEAKLTAIGLTIRFVILLERPINAVIKVLALDDLLISLDMQHRMQIIDIIFDVFKPDYQIILLTHDVGFYREIKRRTNHETENWLYLEFFESESENHPKIKTGKSDLEKARDYLEDNDFEACAVQLRKATEAVLKNFLEKKMAVCFEKNTFVTLGQYLHEAKNIIDKKNYSKFRSIIESGAELKEKFNLILSQNGINLQDPAISSLSDIKKGELIAKLRGTEFTLFSELFKFLAETQAKEIQISKMLDEIENIKNRVLNQGAHASDAPLYMQELRDAMEKIKILQELLK